MNWPLRKLMPSGFGTVVKLLLQVLRFEEKSAVPSSVPITNRPLPKATTSKGATFAEGAATSAQSNALLETMAVYWPKTEPTARNFPSPNVIQPTWLTSVHVSVTHVTPLVQVTTIP